MSNDGMTGQQAIDSAQQALHTRTVNVLPVEVESDYPYRVSLAFGFLTLAVFTFFVWK